MFQEINERVWGHMRAREALNEVAHPPQNQPSRNKGKWVGGANLWVKREGVSEKKRT